jgi:outer membrane protein W
LGFHYEPPLTEVLNLTVTAKYHFLYWAENKEEMMYHLPQASVGVKFLMDVYTILPFIGGGVSFNLNAYRPNDAFSKRTYYDAGIRFAPGVYFDLGADIYVSDEFGVGFNVRYDWVIDYFYSDPKIPNLLCLNMRLNFMTLN